MQSQYCQKDLVIVLVVALQLCLGREVLHHGPHESLPPAQETFDLLLLLFVHLQHPFCQEGLQVVHHIRPFLLGEDVARCVFGQAGFHLGQDLGVPVLDVKLLQLHAQAGALGRGGGMLLTS